MEGWDERAASWLKGRKVNGIAINDHDFVEGLMKL